MPRQSYPIHSTTQVRGKEATAARKFLDLIDTLSFDPAVFVTIVTNNPSLEVQKRALKLFTALVYAWCVKYDNQLWKNQEEFEFLVQAKKAQNVLQAYFGAELS